MNWKSDLRLSDLPSIERLEVTCRRCGRARYERAAQLLTRKDFAQAHLDEVEARLKCSDRHCGGPVRIARIHEGGTEGFVGGLA